MKKTGKNRYILKSVRLFALQKAKQKGPLTDTDFTKKRLTRAGKTGNNKKEKRL